MMSLLVLLWACGWLAGLSLRAFDRGEVVVVDLFVMVVLSWVGALVAITDATARRQIWRGKAPVNSYRQARTSYQSPPPSTRGRR